MRSLRMKFTRTTKFKEGYASLRNQIRQYGKLKLTRIKLKASSRVQSTTLDSLTVLKIKKIKITEYTTKEINLRRSIYIYVNLNFSNKLSPY